MAQYIDKSALVAEIENRIKEIDEIGTYLSPKGVLTNLLCHLSTLEVKEVDLEDYVHGTVDYPIIGSDFPNIYPNYKELKNYCDKNRIMDNDKVKLIIVKEDMP